MRFVYFLMTLLLHVWDVKRFFGGKFADFSLFCSSFHWILNGFFATLCICRFLNKNLKGKLNLQRVLIEILNFDWLVAAFNQLQMDFISKFEVFNWNFNENLSWEWDFHSIIHFKRFLTFQIYKKNHQNAFNYH